MMAMVRLVAASLVLAFFTVECLGASLDDYIVVKENDKSNDPRYSNYKKVASEEVDSSEYGLRTLTGTKRTSCDCGWANKPVRRIMNGKNTGKYEFPWSVSLQFKTAKIHFCGGSIITPYHVLTAAHCVIKESPEVIRVVMGTNNRSDYSVTADVKQIYVHSYDVSTNIYDIAILELKTKIEYTQFVGPVCLPRTDPKITGQYVTAMALMPAGKGRQDPVIQQKVHLRAIDLYSCSKDWTNRWNADDPKIICTWSKDKDICAGDSGGPVVWHDPEIHRYTLMGMPAACDGCIKILPSAHTFVPVFYDWIQQVVSVAQHPDAKTCSKID